MRHLDVGKKHVRRVLDRERHRLAAVARERYHGDVGFRLEERSKCAEHHALIFRDDHSYHAACSRRSGADRERRAHALRACSDRERDT